MDRKLTIATAHSRRARTWSNKTVSWEKLCSRCAKATQTAETHGEYMAMSRDEQGRIKDVGGFVGGHLKGGVRKRENVVFRSLLTLDIDSHAVGAWEAFKSRYDCAALIYSTHKHTAERPRYRLVIPLARDVKPEEYEPMGRRVADMTGIEMFDPTTYEASRLMYWPSHSLGAEFFFDRQEGEWLDPDEVLGTYVDWCDASEWPRSEKEGEVRSRERKKMGDPTAKPGVIGAFCRAYTIEDAIDTFLGDVYEPTTTPGRYTYANGSMAGGLVCYEGKFAQSFHATDPAGGKEWNAFDIVRIHKFGDRDNGEAEDITKAPSYKAMTDFALKDGKTKVQMSLARREAAMADFDGIDEEMEEEDQEWVKLVEYDKGGNPKCTIENAVVIIENDPKLKGKLWYDSFKNDYMVDGGLPWREEASRWANIDDSNLRAYLEKEHGMVGKDKIKDALNAVFTAHRRNPPREYLESLRWDGRERLDTMIIRYLGADDTPLVRAVTRMHFTAAVARVMNPGCKYDICLILAGPEGIGKSTLLAVMGGEWYNDSLSLAGMDRKSAMEQVCDGWLFELSELSGMRKSEVEPVKSFITRLVDKFRPAYGTVVESRPRHCVFCGTTNETAFLRGDTGNRRFIVIDVHGAGRPMADVFSELSAERDQIWAEAVHRYKNGGKLYLEADMEEEARKTQEAHHEYAADPMVGMIDRFLDTPLPASWPGMSLQRRRQFFDDPDSIDEEAAKSDSAEIRMEVCASEFLQEFLRMNPSDGNYAQMVRKFGAIMKTKKDWEPIVTINHVRQLYGRQRGFRRKISYNEDDL